MNKLYSNDQMDLAKQIIEKGNLKTGTDVSKTFKDMLGCVIQLLLDEELNEQIGYSKGSHNEKSSTNRRNGSTTKSKKVKTTLGTIEVQPPRDREGKFEPIIIKKRQRTLDKIEDLVILLYAKGNSLNDISQILKEIYNVNMSSQMISNMTNKINEEAKKWQERPLKKCYPICYTDCIYCYIRKDLTSIKMAVYVIIGIGYDGKKEVIGIWIGETESASTWYNILEEIKRRGVEDVMFFCMDGLEGLANTIGQVYPNAITQRCIVHIVRNIYNMLPKKEVKATIADFKKIYTTSDLEACKLEYKNFKEKYKDNKKLIKKTDSDIEHIYSIFEYPESIRKLIYTTNIIESVNSALRKVTRGKGCFINQQALIKVLYLRIKDLDKKWKNKINNWEKICFDLGEIFGERFTRYLE